MHKSKLLVEINHSTLKIFSNVKQILYFKTVHYECELRYKFIKKKGYYMKNLLAIACGEGALELIEIQMEGNKMMLVSEWMKGAQLSDNISFGA